MRSDLEKHNLIVSWGKAALRSLFVGDALAMPVHWFYVPEKIKIAFPGGVQKFEDFPEYHPSSVMSLHSTSLRERGSLGGSASVKELVNDVILPLKINNILESIGNTPHVRLNRLFGSDHEVWMKLERANPGGSIKDRIALEMIEEAEANGKINKDTVIIEPTSGNTGIGLAMVAATKGYRLILTMPESMSIERRRYMTALGAELELTPKEKGMSGAIEKANALLAANNNA